MRASVPEDVIAPPSTDVAEPGPPADATGDGPPAPGTGGGGGCATAPGSPSPPWGFWLLVGLAIVGFAGRGARRAGPCRQLRKNFVTR